MKARTINGKTTEESKYALYESMTGDDQVLRGPNVFTPGKTGITGPAALIIDQDKVELSGVSQPADRNRSALPKEGGNMENQKKKSSNFIITPAAWEL